MKINEPGCCMGIFTEIHAHDLHVVYHLLLASKSGNDDDDDGYNQMIDLLL